MHAQYSVYCIHTDRTMTCEACVAFYTACNAKLMALENQVRSHAATGQSVADLLLPDGVLTNVMREVAVEWKGFTLGKRRSASGNAHTCCKLHQDLRKGLCDSMLRVSKLVQAAGLFFTGHGRITWNEHVAW